MKDEKYLEELSLQLGQQLRQLGKTVTSAESCTGGWIAKALTDIAGSSAYYERGFVTYSNEAKHQMIGVSSQTLENYGAVSQQVVLEMAEGALNQANADFAISVSGIAGPGGGTPDKPVGTVWFGFAHKIDENNLSLSAHHCIFEGDRHCVRLQSAIFSLETLLQQITKKFA
ncbi:nicotinamide-nucleotide amidase [Moellerella wisconsensis]|uniref:Nicotinamide-nucleotide amidase n=3 Tax=Moellerella wisconsensis TaxID=158849 RepID=A0ACD3Y989_9GAMM|nr:nicotinamide-nucleotide amidase [Moellerella wisconsensis]KLN97864.1 hypothetical protein VK86_02470 [Moellerella wisconsensis]KPD01802.1 putative DNA repair protein [Moellerella wisconsensis ATCC 35017]UNH24823.1 nicotinamide-nucleotide amidase [Moellerella wisconsensis]UNH27938.1 nicotinamide-nucleotide amidase [Moellerella wisconsensis]UNH31443.1 nicotinamide-nucleotide amidase [Moellerella wisconsensis]